MGHVFFRPTRLKLAAILPLTIVWLAFAGGAHAANPAGNSISNTPGNQSTTWDGMRYEMGFIGDPTQCPSADPANLPFSDPTNERCDHFQLLTQTTGAVEAVATWPGQMCEGANAVACEDPTMSDFDLLVCIARAPVSMFTTPPPDTDRCIDEMSGTDVIPYDEVAFSAVGAGESPQFERVTWNAVGGSTYEVRVLPTSVFPPGMDYRGCAEYTDGLFTRVCAQVPSPIPAPVSSATFLSQSGGCDSTTPNTTDSPRSENGGGDVPSPGTANSDRSAHFSMQVRRKQDGSNPARKGKMYYKDQTADGTKRDFKSQTVSCVSFQDGANVKNGFRGKAEFRGLGKLKIKDPQESNVCYRAVGTDNGDPGPGNDIFEFQLFLFNDNGTPDNPDDDFCGPAIVANGPVPITGGNIEYHFTA